MTTEQPYTPSVEQIEADWKAYVTTHDPDNYYDAISEEEAQARWDRAIAQVRRDAAREAAQMIRDACDRWEVDGDDERLVNDVLDPWTTRILNSKETS